MDTIEIICGNDRVVHTVLEFISNANNKIDVCIDIYGDYDLIFKK